MPDIEKCQKVYDRYTHLMNLLNEKYDDYWQYQMTPEETRELNEWYSRLKQYIRIRGIQEFIRICETEDEREAEEELEEDDNYLDWYCEDAAQNMPCDTYGMCAGRACSIYYQCQCGIND